MKNKFSKRALHQQLALAGLLGISAFTFQSTANAADYGSLNGNTITLSDGDVVTADTTYNSTLIGIHNAYGSTAQINLGSGSKVIANGNASPAKGIYLQGNNTVLNADSLSIDVKGSYTTGLDMSGSKSQVDLGSGSQVIVEGTTGARGIFISGASTLTADALTIKTTGTGGTGLSVDSQGSIAHLGSGSSISTNGQSSDALHIFGANGNAADGPAKFDATNLTLLTEGNNSYGINIQANSIVDLGSDSTITTHGNNSTGVWVHGEFKADALSLTTTGGGNSVALEVRAGGKSTVGANSHLRADKNSTLVATGVGAVANFKGTATERNTIFSGGSTGASAQLSGTVNLENTDITVDRNGSTAYAVWAAGGVVNAVNTTVTGTNGVYGVVANSAGGKAYFTGETAITMASPDAVAMISDGAGNLISGIGKMNIAGGVYAQNNATTDLKMTQGSVLTGGASAFTGGTTNLSFDNSRWNMSEDSDMTKLVLNNSIVDFTEDKTGSVLQVKDFSGSNGTFVMRVNMDTAEDPNAVSADKLVVTGTSAGSHNIRVINRGQLATKGTEVITVVETQDGQATFGLSNINNRAELGGYVYDIRRNEQNTNNWELYSSGKGGGGEISPTSDNSGNFLNVGYLLNYAETQTLLQRMGELRQTANSQGDVWARAFTGKFDSFGGGKLSGFDMDYTGVQAGVDKRLSVRDADLYLGVMGGATKADTSYKQGDGDVKGYHFGIYGSYVAPNDVYVDGVLKYSHLKNSFNIKNDDYGQIDNSANSDGYGLSLEVGKRFYFADNRAGYYIEPQAQLSYSHQGSVSSTASSGLKVDLDSYDSVLGRVSAIVGYAINKGSNPVNVYFKTGYVTEMSGDVSYRLNGSEEAYDFGGGWWDNGIGVTTQLNKKHNLYLDGTYSSGNKFDQLQINAGYRYSF